MDLLLEMPVVTERRMPPALPTKLQERLTTVYDGLFSTIAKAYSIPDTRTIYTFLRQQSQLLPILIEGRAVVSFFFGEETPITLTLMRDADIGFEYLIAWINVPLPSEEALDKLLDLGDTWLRTHSSVISDRLSFNLGAI